MVAMFKQIQNKISSVEWLVEEPSLGTDKHDLFKSYIQNNIYIFLYFDKLILTN